MSQIYSKDESRFNHISFVHKFKYMALPGVFHKLKTTILGMISLAIHKTRGYHLRIIQIIAILLFIHIKYEGGNLLDIPKVFSSSKTFNLSQHNRFHTPECV